MRRQRKEKQTSPQKGQGLKKSAAPTVFVLGRELGVGSYNCTFLLDNGNEVLRMGFLPDVKKYVEANKSVLRGLEIVHVFNSFESILGPSLLKEISNYRVIDEDELDKHVRGQLCEKIIESQNKYNNGRFALQHIEYLGGGLFNNKTYTTLVFTPEELCFSVFSLVWFFASSQQYFSFRHHDLKAGNLMLRNTTDAHLYHFTVDNTNTRYQFKSHVVPVVIDFDFATVYTSQSLDDRDAGGTEYTCSPDAAIFLLHLRNGIDYEPPSLTYEDHAYDWWSIGVCILELVLPVEKLYGLFGSLYKPFLDNAMQAVSFLDANDYEFNRRVLRGLFQSCCFAALVHESDVRPPRTEHYGPIATMDDVWYGWTRQVRNHRDYKKMRRVLKQDIPMSLLELLQKLLSWDPKERNAYGKPMELILKSSYFDKYKTAMGAPERQHADIHVYTGSNKVLLEEGKYLDHIQVKDHPFLALRMCEVCDLTDVGQINPLYMCQCCGKVVCGEACQSKIH